MHKKFFDLILQSWYNLYFLKLYNSLDLFCLYIYLAKFTDLKQQSVLKILFFWAMFYANIDHMFHLLIIFMQILIIFSNYITLLSIPDAWNWLNPVIVCITLDSTLNHAVSQKKNLSVMNTSVLLAHKFFCFLDSFGLSVLLGWQVDLCQSTCSHFPQNPQTRSLNPPNPTIFSHFI